MFYDDLAQIVDAPLWEGTNVLLRLDLNVPCQGGRVVNDYRIKRALPTLQFLIERKCKTVIVSHIESEGNDTLLPIFDYLKERCAISFARTLDEAQRVKDGLAAGGVLLLENIRQESGEKKNDPLLARRLAALADVYISDAFAALHRAHASIVGVPRLLPSFAGFLVLDEVRHLSIALTPPRPAAFIIGGGKIETKLPLVSKFLDSYDQVFVGGALANDIFRAQGLSIGGSLVSSMPIDNAIVHKPNLSIPSDVTISDGTKSALVDLSPLAPSARITDAGPQTNNFLATLVNKSAFVLWNGPLGEYEKGFSESTDFLARAIATSGATSVLGGGDTIAAVEKLGLLDRFGFVSTGGGAMLEFLDKETLPGLEVLRKKS